jgi:hypothetical protein
MSKKLEDTGCGSTGCDCGLHRRKAKEDKPDYPYDIMEFYIRKLKGEIVVEQVREDGREVTRDAIQRHLWEMLRKRKAGGEKFSSDRYYDVLNGFHYLEYPPLAEDEDLRCAVFCEELYREQGTLDTHGWYNEGLQRDALEKCDLPPLKRGAEIEPYNNRAYMDGFFESPYGEKRLKGVGDLGVDLVASTWRASPELQEQYPTKSRISENGEDVPVREGVPGFEYEHEGWLDMPRFEQRPDK